MKKKLLTISVIITLLFVSCSSDKGPEGFDRDTDYQYQYASDGGNISWNIQTADSDNNLYFVCQNYLMKYDPKKNICKPLCSKANCLHQKETEEDRKGKCTAYIPWKPVPKDYNWSYSLFYYKNNIYFAYEAQEGKNDEKNWHIDRISKDGKSRDRIASWVSNCNEMIQHRGVLYFAREYTDKEGKFYAELDYLKLDHPGHIHTLMKPKVSVRSSLKPISAYGKYLYINYCSEDAEAGDDNYLDHFQSAIYVYNVETKKKTTVHPDGKKQTDMIDNVVPFQDRIFFTMQDMTHAYDLEAKTFLYSCKPDGSDVKVEKKDILAWNLLYADKDHLFLSDLNKQEYQALLASRQSTGSGNSQQGIESEMGQTGTGSENSFTVTTEVFDKDRKECDIFTEEGGTYFPSSDIRIGIGDYRYNLCLNKAGSAYELHKWNKKKLGSLHGQSWTSEVVATIPHEDSSDSVVSPKEE